MLFLLGSVGTFFLKVHLFLGYLRTNHALRRASDIGRQTEETRFVILWELFNDSTIVLNIKKEKQFFKKDLT